MLVEAHNLTKKYGDNLACNNICLSLKEGQVFGLLGPNGAGKSTLVKMFLGLVKPTSGQAFIQGKPVSSIESRKNTGYLPELFRFYEWLTAYDLLKFYARINGVSARDEKHAIEDALVVVGLKGRENERIHGYSKGMQQRLGMAAAIVHNPVLLFLDEPTSALDPIGRREFRDIIKALKERGKTVFLNSHLLGEMEMTCTHLGFIKKGELISQGKIEEFMQDSHEVIIEAEKINCDLLEEWNQQGTIFEYRDNKLVLQVDKRNEIPEIISRLVLQGARIYKVESKSRGLEEVFLEMIEN